MHAFLSNLANRQTNKQTRANAFTSCFVGGDNLRTVNIGLVFLSASLYVSKRGAY